MGEKERERESSLNSLSLNHLNQTAYSVLRTLFLSISPTDYDSGSLALSVHISVSPSLSELGGFGRNDNFWIGLISST